MYLNIELEGEEEKNFLDAKERSGIKSNTDFLRHIIKRYILKAYGSIPSSKLKVIMASDIDFDDPLDDPSENEQSYRRGFMHGFIYCHDTPFERYERTLNLLYDWRYKMPSSSMIPAFMYVQENEGKNE